MKKFLKNQNKWIVGIFGLAVIFGAGFLIKGTNKESISPLLTASVNKQEFESFLGKQFQRDRIVGFNWGQIFHHLQLQYGNNGYAPEFFVKFLKDNYPESMLKNVRFSGTVSNYLLINKPGYNFLQNTVQLRNQRKSEPTESYIYPFVDLYKKLGAETLSFTFNSHTPYLSGDPQDLESAFKTLEYVAENANLISIELENESYLYKTITGSSAGTPNLMERIELTGSWVTAGNMRLVENAMRARVNKYLDFVEQKIVPELRSEYPGIPLGMSIAKTDNLRARIWTQEVLKRDFYDFLIPHLYYAGPEDQVSIDRWITDYMRTIQKSGVYYNVTEFNWNYNVNKNGPSNLEQFRTNFFTALKNQSQIKDIYFHTIWHGLDANGWNRSIPLQ